MTMTRGNNPPSSRSSNDAEVADLARLARHYRHQTIATLVTITRDTTAPASARAMAARTLMEYSDGRPSQARQPTVADLATMPDDQKMQLLVALVNDHTPNGFMALLQQSVDEAIALDEVQPRLPRPNRFTRGTPAPRLAHHPQRQTPPVNAMNGDPATIAADHAPAHSAHAQHAGQFQSAPQLPEPEPAPSNVVPFSANSENEPPFGLKFGLADTLDTTNNTTSAAPVNGVHHSVLARSARPLGMAMDLAFRGYRK
jgi:hypothetical protein